MFTVTASRTDARVTNRQVIKKRTPLENGFDALSEYRMNRKFRQIDRPTDVLSFPNLLEPGRTNMQLITDKLDKITFASEINPENGTIFVGDICICKSVVFKQAKEYGNTKLREIVYMAVHGLLHLLGYDHMTDDDKAVMREMEEKIMKKVHLERE